MNVVIRKKQREFQQESKTGSFSRVVQRCPVCSELISALPGTRDAVCRNCGYKDPCCE